MANLNMPTGANPVRYVSGAPYNGAVNPYSMNAANDAVATFVGDFVKFAGTSQLIGDQTLLDVAQAATGDVMVGAIVAMDPINGAAGAARDALQYRAASTQRVVWVADDPNILFEIQEGTGGTVLTANDAGLNANFAVGSGSTATGRSAMTVNNVGEATTNTLDLRLVEPVNRPDNTVGSDSQKWLVRINRHSYVNQVAGV